MFVALDSGKRERLDFLWQRGKDLGSEKLPLLGQSRVTQGGEYLEEL